MSTLLSFILAAFGISFIVFIHEYGHYWMARRVGMRVEVFSIGFGKPLFSWVHDGVKWQVCALLFGGYVRVAGMEGDKGVEPHNIKGGYFQKKPYQRILMVLMGPLVNIVFAGLVFTGIWVFGGRLKPFHEYTQIVGTVDSKSELAKEGVGPGDIITYYNNEPFTGFKDLLYHGVTTTDRATVKGQRVNYFTGNMTPFDYSFIPYTDQRHHEFKTIGLMSPASFLIFDKFKEKEEQFSPLASSNIAAGDRIIWADGEVIFSASQLSSIVNQDRALFTIERDGKRLLARIPRVAIGELQISPQRRGEIVDWKRELSITKDVKELYFIPYEVSDQLVVQNSIAYIDSDIISESVEYTKADAPLIQLQKGDKILSVAGVPVKTSLELFSQLRERQVRIMTQSLKKTNVSWKNEDAYFRDSVEWENLKEMIDGFGTSNGKSFLGGVKLLNPIIPITEKAFYARKLPQGMITSQIEQMSQDMPKYITLGSIVTDKLVSYNPTPIQEMKNCFNDFAKIISSLVSGQLSPKWLSGPVGMVRVMHAGWQAGLKDALYWMAMISFNLGIINLMPIPVLDGGHICFAIYEWVTKRRISQKTMERMLLPFIVFLIAGFLYVTFHDISRLF